MNINHEARVERLAALVREAELDGIVITDPASIYYFSGATGFGSWRRPMLVVGADGSPTLLMPALEFDLARTMTWMTDIRQFVEYQHESLPPDGLSALLDVLGERGWARSRIGLELEILPAALVARLQAAVPEASLVEAGDLPAGLRLIKEPAELDLMRKAGQVGVAEVEAAVEALAAGQPEYEVTIAARAAGTRKAAELIGPDDHLISPVIESAQILAVGPERGIWPHGWASTRPMRYGDLAEMCFCTLAHFYGYHLGLDRTVPVGSPPAEQKQLLDWGMEASRVGVETVRAGVKASAVARAIDGMMEREGLLGYRLHRHGRGVGIGFSEAPDISDLDDTVLQPGMTFSIEPGIYIPGVGGVRIGDTVAVTADGCEVLTPAPYYWPR
jgi:Xaa-Pro aminopeptidase